MKKSNPFGLLIHFERKTRLEPPLRVGIFLASLYLHPQPLEEVFGVARGESCFPLHVKPPLSKGGLEGLYIWSRNLSAKRTKKG